MEYFSRTAVLGTIGIGLAFFAWFCSNAYASDPSHTRFFGTQIPMAWFGILGYVFIALTAWIVTKEFMSGWQQKAIIVVNHLAVAFAALFTIFLVWKAFQVRLFCPGCILCWGMNIYLAGRLAGRFLPV